MYFQRPILNSLAALTSNSLPSLFFSHSFTPSRSTPAFIKPSFPRRLISWSGFTTSFCKIKQAGNQLWLTGKKCTLKCTFLCCWNCFKCFTKTEKKPTLLYLQDLNKSGSAKHWLKCTCRNVFINSREISYTYMCTENSSSINIKMNMISNFIIFYFSTFTYLSASKRGQFTQVITDYTAI